MQFMPKVVVFVSLVALSGCAELEQISQEMQKATTQMSQATAPAMIDHPVSQICKAAEDNKVRADSLYGGKRLTVTAEVRSVNQRVNPRYAVFLEGEGFDVYATTNDLRAVSVLTSGNKVNVSGVVGQVTNIYPACAIYLDNATFQ